MGSRYADDHKDKRGEERLQAARAERRGGPKGGDMWGDMGMGMGMGMGGFKNFNYFLQIHSILNY